MFLKAVKFEEKLRLCIAGVAGSGKTYTALRVGCAIAKDCGGRVAMVDTEHRSARKYADIFDFDTVDIDPPYHPRRIGEIIASAVKADYKVLIVDSMSHFWQGKGGLLEEVDKFAKKNSGGNSFAAWKDATPIQVQMVEDMLAAGLHLIVCVRSKMEFDIQEIEGRNGRTRKVPVKIGMSPIQRSDIQYEFDVYGQMTQDNDLIIEKTRCPALAGEVINRPGEKLAGVLLEWTKGEAAPAREATPAPPEEPTTPPKASNGKATKAQRNKLAELTVGPYVTPEMVSFINGELEKNGNLTKARAQSIIDRAEQACAITEASDEIPF